MQQINQQTQQQQQESVPKIQTVDIKQEGLVHDTQYDYYGKRLAVCSSDGSVQIYEVQKTEGIHLTAQFNASDKGPVWQVAWAHPRFGSIIATCSYDKKVSIWKEIRQNEWVVLEQHSNIHQASVNSIQWAPSDSGLKLVAGSSDGIAAIYSLRNSDDTWNQPIHWEAHELGINGVAWQPFNNYNDLNLDDAKSQKLRLITGSCDQTLKIWELDEQLKHKQIMTLEGHTGWVRDVAWSPAMNNYQLIASCSEDKTVRLWKITDLGGENQNLESVKEIKLGFPCWRVSWSLTGSMLAVSSASQDHEGAVHILKENEQGEWEEQKGCVDLNQGFKQDI